MSSPTIHTLGARDVAPGPWAVGVAFRGRVTVQAGPGAEDWARAFIRDHVTRETILPWDPAAWPVGSMAHV